MKGKLPTVPDTNHSVPACQEYSHSQLAITINHATIQYVRFTLQIQNNNQLMKWGIRNHTGLYDY